jgi:hypothetical protein
VTFTASKSSTLNYRKKKKKKKKSAMQKKEKKNSQKKYRLQVEGRKKKPLSVSVWVDKGSADLDVHTLHDTRIRLSFHEPIT